MKQIAGWISEVLNHSGDESALNRIKGQVRELCQTFPIYK
jgi:glycine hydroxymethyltransferase